MLKFKLVENSTYPASPWFALTVQLTDQLIFIQIGKFQSGSILCSYCTKKFPYLKKKQLDSLGNTNEVVFLVTVLN